MKLAVVGLAFAVVLLAAGDKPRVSNKDVSLAAQRLDVRLAGLLPDDPVSPVGLTQGAYIPGFGVVFMGTLNLAPMAGISPFHQTITKQEITRVHQKKVDRLPKLKEAMQDMLTNMAASIDTLSGDEQISIVVSLFNFSGEDISGIPAQIVVHGQKKAILDGKGNPGLLTAAVRVDEF